LRVDVVLPNVKIIDDSRGNRATARQKGIEAVETEWHSTLTQT